MLGPVFYLELLLGSRRGRLDLLRRFYAGFLAVEFLYFYLNFLTEKNLSSSLLQMLGWTNYPLGRFVNAYLSFFVVQHFLLLFLATPVFAAGSITDEKMRGTLQYLLATDLTSWEIIVGKLLGRMAQVGLIALAGLPLIAFMVAYGNLHWTMILALVIVTVVTLFALGALSLLLSVWCRKTSEAVLCVYPMLAAGTFELLVMHSWVDSDLAPRVVGGKSVGILERLLYYLASGLRCLDPFYVLEPVWDRNDPGTTAWRLLAAVLTWGAIGTTALGIAVWRLRPAYFRQMEHTVRKSFWPLRKTRKVDEADPIAWREREVEGMAPLPWLRRVPRWLGMAVVVTTTVILPAELLGPSTLVVFFVSTLVAGIRSSASICGERESQTWETILLTPLETKEIVRGKYRGIVQAVYPYLIAYSVSAVARTPFLWKNLDLWFVISLPSCFFAIWFMASLGLNCSVRSRSSWRSLLATLGQGYISVIALFLCSFILHAILFFLLCGMTSLYTWSFPNQATEIVLTLLSNGLIILVLFMVIRESFETHLKRAENWVEINERN